TKPLILPYPFPMGHGDVATALRLQRPHIVFTPLPLKGGGAGVGAHPSPPAVRRPTAAGHAPAARVSARHTPPGSAARCQLPGHRCPACARLPATVARAPLA